MTPHRAIDTPLEHLASLDEHSIEIDAPAEVVWAALFPMLGRVCGGRLSVWLAKTLGSSETGVSGDIRHPGGTLPGFVVARSVPPVMLALLGEHRFARYALIFRVDLLPGERSRVRAETLAEFPGPLGRIYRLAIVGSRGHVVVVNSMLRGLKKRAETRR